jgi:kumamolisin
MDAALEAAVASGVAVFAASGDSGFTDGEPDGVAHVDYPASSPYAIGCGGTRIIAARGKIESETVWNNGAQGGATGGGVSGAYALPGYQGALSYTEIGQSPQPLKMRGVPDVAALGDPITGYIISVNGQRIIVGGTSAVSPLYSALYALILEYRNTTKKPPPDFLKAIYKNAKPMKLFRDIIAGNNSYYEATVGYDCCTGLGSPNGIALADFFHNNL